MQEQWTQAQPDQSASGVSQSGWPGGWYVYEDGRVVGPLAAEDAFRLEFETNAGKPRMVSRKGFSQWYALKDLSEIFRMTEHLGHRAAKAVAESELLMRRGEAAVQPSPSAAPTAASFASTAVSPGQELVAPKVRSRSVGRAAPPPVAPAPTTPVVAPIAVPGPTRADQAFAQGAPSQLTHAPGERPVVMPGLKAERDAPAEPVPAPTAGAAAPAPAAKGAKPPRKMTAAQVVMQEYFYQRGRLRLGKLRNAWAVAFFGLPLTLGTYWVAWFMALAKEIGDHSQSSPQARMPPLFLCAVPLVHVYMTYRLAKALAEMEAQNRYRGVSPAAAAAFALFPPFAVAYLQEAANRHWLLHARHALAKRQQPEGAPPVEAALAPGSVAPASPVTVHA